MTLLYLIHKTMNSMFPLKKKVMKKRLSFRMSDIFKTFFINVYEVKTIKICMLEALRLTSEFLGDILLNTLQFQSYFAFLASIFSVIWMKIETSDSANGILSSKNYSIAVMSYSSMSLFSITTYLVSLVSIFISETT